MVFVIDVIIIFVFVITAAIGVVNLTEYDMKLVNSEYASRRAVGNIFKALAFPAKIICFAIIIYYLAFSGNFDGVF